MSNTVDFEYGTDERTGRAVVMEKNRPERGERTQTLSAVLSPVSQSIRKIEQSVKALEKLGFDVPAILRNAVDNISAIRKIAVEPVQPNPADDSKTFQKDLAAYASALRDFNAQKDAQTRVLEAAYSHALGVRKAASDEIMPALAARFDEAAKVYAEHFAVLRDVDNIGEAAATDPTGALVVRWHAMTAAADDMNALLDVWKNLTPSVTGDNWTSEDLLAVCAKVSRRDAALLGNEVREQRGDRKAPDARYRALLGATYTLRFARSRKEFLGRLAKTEDDDLGDEG